MMQRQQENTSASPGGSHSATSQPPAVADSHSPQAKGRLAHWPDRWTVSAVCVFLMVIIWVVFGQTVQFAFVNLDDNLYVYDNPEVVRGLTLHGIVWAFTHFYAENWHPLTWISHMLDCQLYGLNAGGPHLTNVLLHSATAILLFLVLRQMTGFLWRSAFVAAVFAIHPLRAESVAWVAERKDVLSGVFFMLTLWAYARYVQVWSRVVGPTLLRPTPGRPKPGARASLARAYAPVLLFFALGLMCKPMLVTLPLVLLLLDYWPLNRFVAVNGRGNSIPIWPRLILEKLPLFVLAAASCVLTLCAQTGSMALLRNVSPALRAGNALISSVTYLRQMFWPSGLAAYYPFAPGDVRLSSVALSLVVLAGISAVVFVLRRQRHYLLTGWLWYLIMLVPVIGVVQVGEQSHADRYTYLPQIGLYLLVTWAAAELCAGWRYRRAAFGGASAIILTALIFCARAQTGYWRNSESLWTRALACTTDNWFADNNLGAVLLQKGNVDEAVAQFQKTLQINPDDAKAYVNLGLALCRKGNVDEGIAQYQKALPIDPDSVEARVNLGNALLQKGEVDAAIAQYQQTLRIDPDYADAYNDLGSALCQKGYVDEAITQYRQALQINPNSAQIHDNLGSALLKAGSLDEAMTQFQEAVQINPHLALAHDNLGNLLMKMGRVDEALAQFQAALKIDPDLPQVHNNLATILAQRGQIDEAIVHFEKAVQLNPNYAAAHNNLGSALLIKGKVVEANAQYQKALQINPNYVQSLNGLAWVLATSPQASLRNGGQAVKLAQRANHLTGDGNPALLGTLAAAYAEAGRFPEAVETAQQALLFAESQGNAALAEALRSQLKLYQAGSPFRAKPTL